MIQYVADRQALYMQAKQPRSDILYMTTLDTGRCSHTVSESNAMLKCVHLQMLFLCERFYDVTVSQKRNHRAKR